MIGDQDRCIASGGLCGLLPRRKGSPRPRRFIHRV
uniref:Uncharacterized protein n=1 Tax=Pseudomonas phage BL5 TaxID=3109218 RepID=A0AAU7B9J0_9VIRU